jgi:hypothetical protein
MNMPYQSCPFCVPNTSQLSNTIEVYPKKGQSFSYTNQAVKVTGTLEVAPEGETFSDTYGYEFSFKIVDGSYTVLQDEDMSANMQLWQKFAGTDLMDRLNQMYEYVNFVCAWNTYFMNSYVDDQGNTQPGYYLYPGDAKQLLNSEDGQYYYGTVDGYFDDLIILPLLVMLTIKFIPCDVFAQYREQAQNLWVNGKPKKWYYALPIIIVWAIIIFLIVKAIFF